MSFLCDCFYRFFFFFCGCHSDPDEMTRDLILTHREQYYQNLTKRNRLIERNTFRPISLDNELENNEIRE